MHRQQSHIQECVLRFKRWSRKAYAAFMSLHRQVSIGSLAVEISDRIGKKSKTKTPDEHARLHAMSIYGMSEEPDEGSGEWMLLERNNTLAVRLLNIELPKAFAFVYVCFMFACFG